MSTFNGYFEAQFGRKIRADRFTQQDPATLLQFLSHAHADHTVGLASKDLRGYVYCSEATKDIILRSATASERVYAEVHGVKSDDYYTFPNLQEAVYNARGKPMIRDGKKVRVDVLKTLNVGNRHNLSAEFHSPLAVTLIDANHCPGAVMFLIESPQHAILYTGDVRSEPFLINNLTKNPCLKDFLVMDGQPPLRMLDQIYLDTSAALNKGRLLSKMEGVNEALELFDLFPPKTRFFINCWTWGYEELLRAIAHKYRCKIHLDEYKAKIYRQDAVSSHDLEYSCMDSKYPALNEIGTSKFQATRFHACERRWKCPHVRGDGQGCFNSEEMQAIWEDEHETALRQDRVLKSKGLLPHTVFVDPADATVTGWARYKEKITAQCAAAKSGHGEWPTNLLVPLARHSSLPELQDLVSLFKPQNIYPNTLYPDLKGHDYLLLAQYFAHTLAKGGKERLSRDAREYQESIATLGLPKADKRTRSPSPQEEEQSQEVQEELKSKFISASAQFSEDYITSNFDHLDDPADLKLLVACEEEDSQVATRVQEEVVSQELPEIARPLKRKGQSVKSDQVAQADRIEAWCDAQRANTASPPVPSSSNDDIEAVPSAHKQQMELLQRPVTAKESQLSFRNNVVCFDLEFEREDVEEVRSGIKNAGGGILDFGPSKESIKTAISASDIIVCKRRGTLLLKAAAELERATGNLDWLTRCLQEGSISDPQLVLLHQPFPATPLKGLDGLNISSTGFDEENKVAIKALAAALGFHYLPELSRTQTKVLIANGCKKSKKTQYAEKWGIPVVNLLWLEDCFVHGKLMPVQAYDDLEQTTESLNRRVGNKTARVVPGPTPPHHEAAALATAAPSISLSKRPLQPATVKRKQQTATLSVQESPKSRKKQKENEHTGASKRRDLPETFESVSTVNGDDPSKIQRAKEAVQKGLGLPRILSCDILTG